MLEADEPRPRVHIDLDLLRRLIVGCDGGTSVSGVGRHCLGSGNSGFG